MTSLKTDARLIILLVTLALSNVLSAEESVKNAHKDIGVSNTVRHADTIYHVDGNFCSTVKVKTTASSQQIFTNDFHAFKQMQKAFKRYSQERRQQSAAYNQTQRKAYFKLMQERRTIMKKMMDGHRQAAQERRKTMLLKMHQTSTTPARYYS